MKNLLVEGLFYEHTGSEPMFVWLKKTEQPQQYYNFPFVLRLNTKPTIIAQPKENEGNSRKRPAY